MNNLKLLLLEKLREFELDESIITKRKHLQSYIENKGWKLHRSSSHFTYKHPKSSKTLAIPNHKDLSHGTARQIMKDADNLDINEAETQKHSKDPDNSLSRLDGSDEVVIVYKNDTPGEKGSPKHKKTIKVIKELMHINEEELDSKEYARIKREREFRARLRAAQTRSNTVTKKKSDLEKGKKK